MDTNDYFYNATTKQTTPFINEFVKTPNINGTGCSLSSAIAAFLARGKELTESVRLAEEYIHQAIVYGSDYQFGAGFGPIHHFYQYENLWK